MPYTFIQFELRLGPFVERFDGLAAPAFVTLPPRQPTAVRLIARRNRTIRSRRFRSAFVLWAQKTAAGSMPGRRVFNAFATLLASVDTASAKETRTYDAKIDDPA